MVVAGDIESDVTLVPGVRISGVVRESGVGALAGVTVSAFQGSELKLSTTTGPPGVPGSYGLQYLLPGTYTVRVVKPGSAAHEKQEKKIEALIDTRLDFDLPPQ